jgi:hypothetical protein
MVGLEESAVAVLELMEVAAQSLELQIPAEVEVAVAQLPQHLLDQEQTAVQELLFLATMPMQQ